MNISISEFLLAVPAGCCHHLLPPAEVADHHDPRGYF